MEGFSIAAGIDIDEACRFPFEHNNSAPFIRQDVSTLSSRAVQELFFAGEPQILVGCAPCQPFSSYNQKNSDPKWKLVERFCDLICELKPDIVSMENVPRLLQFQGGQVFRAFVTRLANAGYFVNHKVVSLLGYGLPQRRARLVLLASRHGALELEPPHLRSKRYKTVNQAIGTLPRLLAGEANAEDKLHTSSRLSSLNLRRMKASVPGGTWRDWPESLVASCHRVGSGDGYVSVYGRMRGDEPSPTITTQFFGYGNGRFGHPTQDRGLSLREGAILQSFPEDYEFVPPERKAEFKRLGRMIGNAVPVALARAIARSIKRHLRDHEL